MDRYSIRQHRNARHWNLDIANDPNGEWVKYSDVEALQAERDSCVDLTERMKVALNRIGTKGSYVEWAKECRDAYDQVQNLQARVKELEQSLQGFIDLANESQGVMGWHLNGDVLHWEDVDQLRVAKDLLTPKGTP